MLNEVLLDVMTKSDKIEIHNGGFLFEDILDRSLDASYQRNLQTNRYEYIGPNFETMFGYSIEEANSSSLTETLELIHPSDVEIVKISIDEAIQTGKMRKVDYRFKCKNGDYKWICDQFIVIYDKTVPVFFVGSIQDISHRKEIEYNLALLSTYHQRLNDISLVFSEAGDCDDLFRKIAEKFRFLTGAVASSFSLYEEKDQLLKPVFLSIDSVVREKLDLLFDSKILEMTFPVGNNIAEQMIEGMINRPKDGIYELSFGIISKEISDKVSEIVGYKSIVALSIVYAKKLIGTCIAYIPSDNPIPDAALRIYSDFAGLAIKHKREEESLRRGEKQYRVLFDNANDGIGIVQDGRFKLVNDRFVDMSGYTKKEIYSSPMDVFLHEDCKVDLKEKHERRLRGEKFDNVYQFKGINKAGEVRTIEIVSILIEWEGRPATFDRYRDVTEEIAWEKEKQKIDKLESIGVLAGGIAHDFNNILTSVVGNIALAKDASDDERAESFDGAEKALEQAKRLTHQLLTFSKGGAPITKLSSLTDILKDTAGFALRGSNVKCQLSTPIDLWNAKVDEGQISQVIHNLIVNAQQSMKNGGVIDIIAENVSVDEKQSKSALVDKGDYVKISITDYGVGIDKEHLNKIFDPFFTTKDSGNGLGLATSFSIVRQHGGHLGVKSQERTGSTFFFYLPAVVTGISEEIEEKFIVNTKIADKYKILVMDDELSIKDISGRMLRHLGYKNVQFADRGEDAIVLYTKAMKTKHPFDVVILDLTIPGGMGGKETLKRLVKINPSVKAIVSSGYLDDSVILECRGSGFKGTMSKPYTLSEMGKILQKVLASNE